MNRDISDSSPNSLTNFSAFLKPNKPINYPNKHSSYILGKIFEIEDATETDRLNPLKEENYQNKPMPNVTALDIVKEVSKNLEHSIQRWCRTNPFGKKISELSDILEIEGHPKLAEYLQNCDKNNENFQNDEYEIENYQHSINTPSDLRRPKRRPRYIFQFPVIFFGLLIALFSITGIIGFFIGYTINKCSSDSHDTILIETNLRATHTTQTSSASTQKSISSSKLFILHTTSSTDPSLTSCKPEITSNQQYYDDIVNHHRRQLMPDWSSASVDFCESTDILLILRTENLASNSDHFSELRCPENVNGIEISGPIHWKYVQKILQKLCRIQTVSFAGPEVCKTYSDMSATDLLMSYPMSHLHLEAIDVSSNRCKNFYLEITKYITAYNLKKISFKCVDFDETSSSTLQSLIDAFPTISTLECLDSNNCAGFTANIPKGTKFSSKYVAC